MAEMHDTHNVSRVRGALHWLEHSRHLAHDGLTLIGALDVGQEILHLAIEHVRMILGG